ncbi:MAG: tRNA 4-thiouridine(8) synthase ThiI, partial [Desulfosudaceae bacterium]
MTEASQKPAALGLTSGGLDSILAAVLLQKQGIRVTWLALETPFFSADQARQAAEQLKIPLIVLDITAEYLPLLKNPPCGYGQHMNPCLDCHGLMTNIAGRIMAEEGY